MRTTCAIAVAVAGLVGVLFQTGYRVEAQAPSGAAVLTGQVSSVEEGPMEGVLVNARRVGANVTVTVVTNDRGQYAFPSGRLEPGAYTLSTRAAGYLLDGSRSVTLAAGAPAKADLSLKKTTDAMAIAAGMSNLEWLNSFPGTEEQKASIRGCTHCHTLDLITNSRHDADAFMKVLDRMAGYPAIAFPRLPHKLPGARIGGGEDAGAEAVARQQSNRRKQAEYLATLNLREGTWKYELKTLPRPKGKATQVIYTEWDLPATTRQPHDVIVDSQGLVWYASFGEQILGRLDPKTGKITEWKPPTLRPEAPGGSLAIRFDRDENPWLAMQFQGGIAKFDRKTETFQTWALPPEYAAPCNQLTEVSPDHVDVDGKVWVNDACTWFQYRLDTKTGKWDKYEPFQVPRPNIYDTIADAQNNEYFTVMGRSHIGKIDTKTGQISFWEIPTPNSAPRRGMMDVKGRIWFGENRGDKIGMFDPATKKFQEWTPPTKGQFPYDVHADDNGIAWSGGEFGDRAIRLNSATGEMTEYLFPKETNLRRTWAVTNPSAFWVGNTHQASIVKLEPLDAMGRNLTASR